MSWPDQSGLVPPCGKAVLLFPHPLYRGPSALTSSQRSSPPQGLLTQCFLGLSLISNVSPVLCRCALGSSLSYEGSFNSSSGPLVGSPPFRQIYLLPPPIPPRPVHLWEPMVAKPTLMDPPQSSSPGATSDCHRASHWVPARRQVPGSFWA
jgi:hypothetical protein